MLLVGKRSVSVLFASVVGSVALHGCGGTDAAVSPDRGRAVDCATCDGGTSGPPTGGGVDDAGANDDGEAGAAAPTYPVYAGCEAPATTFARTVYVDPASGTDAGDGSSASPLKTLAAAMTAKKIHAGDHVVLKPGDHGSVLVTKYSNPELQSSTSWIWIDFQPGATAQQLDIRDMSRWLITGGEISSAQTTLVSLSAGSNMIVADARVLTQKDVSTWTANEWLNVASSGIVVRNTTCSAVLRNRVSNVRFGIDVFTDEPDPAKNKMKALVERNDVRRFSGDGMRPNASDVTFRLNRVVDEYVDAAAGDGNHDDAFQMFALNGASYDNILIETNWVQETTDPARPLNAMMQGISVFDGIITHLKVMDNVVLCSAYHGIAGYGIADGVIEGNTVANSSTNGNLTWIRVPPAKDNTPPQNDLVKDDIAASFPAQEPGVTYTNDIVVTAPADAFTTFDRVTATYDLTAKPGSAIDGKGVGSSLKTIHDPRLLPE